MDRPPPEPAKLLEAWMEWERGETPPGRVMSNLKTGGMREVLESLVAQAEAAAAAGVDVPKPSSYGPATPAANTGHLYSAGATHRTRADSLFYYLTSWKYVYGPPKSANQQGVCTFDGGPVPSPLGPYQYLCGGDEPLNFYVFGQRATERKTGPSGLPDEYAVTTDAFGVQEVKRGALSIGGFINGPSPATGAHTTILWVDFR